MSRGAICLAHIHSQLNLHMFAKFCANRSSRLVAIPEFVLRLVWLLAAVRAVTRKNTPKDNFYASKVIFPARTLSPVHTSDADEPPTVGGTNFDAYEYLTGSYSGV